jgi:predicted permease
VFKREDGWRGRFRRTPFWRPPVAEAVDEELRHHLEERVDRLIEEGWEPEAARRESERRFGDLKAIRGEVSAEAGAVETRRWWMGMRTGWMQDLRIAVRGLRRNGGFAAALIATLALGIGATGGVFSVLDAVMFRPLPYDEPDRLVDVQLHLKSDDFYLSQVMADQAGPWLDGQDFLNGTSVHERTSVLHTDEGSAEERQVLAATPGMPELIGLDLALGRTFTEDDARLERRVAMLTWPFFSRLGQDPGIVGRDLVLDDEAWTVIGVFAQGEKYPVAGSVDLWIPMAPNYAVRGRVPSQVSVLGRIRDDLDLESAQARADVLGDVLQEATPHELGWTTRLNPVTRWRANTDTAQGLWMLGGATLLMLVIAAVNATNLLLARGQSRLGEVGVRKALGASRGRVVRHVLVESVVLALAAGFVAMGVAWACVGGIRFIAPEELTFGMVYDFGLEARALSAIFAVATLTGLAVGVLPGFRLAGARTAGSGSAGARTRDRSAVMLRRWLVAGEIAVSVVLLTGAGLFLRSFANVWNADLGMDVDQLAFVSFSLPDSRYPEAADRAAFLDRLVERVRAVPGVAAVAPTTGVPPEGGGLTFGSGIRGEGEDAVPGELMIPFARMSGVALDALGARFLAGRAPVMDDVEPGAVAIDADLAETIFGRADVVGRRFTMDHGADEVRWLTVVGVLEELALGGPDERLGAGALIHAWDPTSPGSYVNLVVRADGDPVDLLAPVRTVIQGEDAQLPLHQLHTARDALGEALERPRFVVLLLAVLAGVALLLAAVGVYGVVSYSVRQSRRELGIRVALGASHARVRGRVLRWGLGTAALGVGLGLAAALWLDGFVADLLFGIEPGDVRTLTGVSVTMLVITLVACALPAHRATRVEPAEVLRAE